MAVRERTKHRADIYLDEPGDLAEAVRDAIAVNVSREVEGGGDLPGGTHIIDVPRLSHDRLTADVGECYPEGAIPTGCALWIEGVEILVSLGGLDAAARQATYDLAIGDVG